MSTLPNIGDRKGLAEDELRRQKSSIGIIVLVVVFFLAMAFAFWLDSLSEQNHPGRQVGAPS